MLSQRFTAIQEQLSQACKKVGRQPSELTLLPVSKTFAPEIIEQAVALGYTRFGENKVQEMKEKAIALAHHHIDWVVIGYLQTNKAKEIAKYASEIQSLDRMDLAVALDKRLQQEGRAIDALVQIKTSREATKSGMAVEDVPSFLKALRAFDTLRIKGFMTVAENSPDPLVVQACFRQVRELAEQMREQTGLALPVLSMGMSGDYELAIAEGATEVRIGSAIFGARDYTSR